MRVLSAGANCPVPSSRLSVAIECRSGLDVSALLCAPGGKVRSDDDFVFYNQPRGPGVTYRPSTGAAASGDVMIDIDQVPPGVDKIVVAASLDGAGPQTFATAGPVGVTIADSSSTEVVRFDLPRLNTETALVCVEVYRRDAGWKIRAVGQGYANGLAGIATDFGVTVDDAPAPQPTHALPPPPALVPPPPPRAMVNLDKGKVTLQKGQSVSLVKSTGPHLSRVAMGLGWDANIRQGADIDLDASLIVFDGQRRYLEVVYFAQLEGGGGAIRHAGDNLTGHGDGDDEVITVDLPRLPPEAAHLVFTINSYSGQDFTSVRNAYARLLDITGRTPKELVLFSLSDAQPTTGVIMCRLSRTADGSWLMTALGSFAKGRVAHDLIEPARLLLG